MKSTLPQKRELIILPKMKHTIDKLPFLWYNQENIFGGIDYG
jgi:hypothetical protein